MVLPPVVAFVNLGATEIALLLLVVVLLFGSTKIPELARSIGRARAEFERGKRELDRQLREEEDERAKKAKEAAAAAPTPPEGAPCASSDARSSR